MQPWDGRVNGVLVWMTNRICEIEKRTQRRGRTSSGDEHFGPRSCDGRDLMEKMCTHIIDFRDRKLKTFKGEKVERYPEKRSYFERR